MMDIVNVTGFLGSCLSFTLWLPQAINVWRYRKQPERLKAISLLTQALVIVCATTWGVYAFASHAYWSGAPGVVNAPLAVLTILLVLRARRLEQDHPLPVQRLASIAESLHGCPNGCGWTGPGEHRIFVTAPPGYGSVVRCHPGARRDGHPVPAPQPELIEAD